MPRETEYAFAMIHALSPVHVGSGQSVDVIDLPIARERATELPVIPGSGMKGMFREGVESTSEGGPDADIVWSIFGPSTDDKASEHAGAVTFMDARLLAFPVRSMRQLFAWVTSPYLLQRYWRDRTEAGLTVSDDERAVLAGLAGDVEALVSDAAMLSGERLRLEDGDLAASVDPQLTTLAGSLATRAGAGLLATLLPRRLAVVSDSMLGHFARHSTEIVARIKLEDKTKTVKKGGLWYEESLPTETLLYTVVASDPSRYTRKRATFSAAEHLETLREVKSAVLGGKATVGRGLCSILWEAAP